MQNKAFGDVDAVQGSIRRKRYNIMAIKDPDYLMLFRTTYRKLENLGGSDTQRR